MHVDLETLFFFVLAQFVTGIVTAAGIYAAIKADLSRAVAKAEHADAAAVRAHDRIDRLTTPAPLR